MNLFIRELNNMGIWYRMGNVPRAQDSTHTPTTNNISNVNSSTSSAPVPAAPMLKYVHSNDMFVHVCDSSYLTSSHIQTGLRLFLCPESGTEGVHCPWTSSPQGKGNGFSFRTWWSQNRWHFQLQNKERQELLPCWQKGMRKVDGKFWMAIITRCDQDINSYCCISPTVCATHKTKRQTKIHQKIFNHSNQN